MAVAVVEARVPVALAAVADASTASSGAVGDDLDLDDRRVRSFRVFANDPMAPVSKRTTARCVGDVHVGRRAGRSRVEAAPTTVASPRTAGARSYRWVACSMTWPPPSSVRPHHAGAGVEIEPAGDEHLGGGRPGGRGPRP